MISAIVTVCIRGDVPYLSVDKGIALPSANLWFALGWPTRIANWTGLLLIMVLMVALNRRYNFIRALTLLYVGFFAVFELAEPYLLVQFSTGTLLAVVVLWCTSLMFSSFGERGPLSNRKVFLVFALLSAGFATEYAYAAYVPVFFIGCLQMRIMSFRAFLSALMGLITPWIMLLGSGLVSVSDIHWPAFVSIFATFDLVDTMAVLLTVLLTVLLLLTSMVMTFFKVLTYNARRRASNGLFTLVAVFTVIAMVIDYTNLMAYLPMLNVCTAYGVGHLFTTHNTPKSYISILSVYALFIGFFVWKIMY